MHRGGAGNERCCGEAVENRRKQSMKWYAQRTKHPLEIKNKNKTKYKTEEARIKEQQK